MASQYEEIQFKPGSTVGQAVDKLLQHHAAGKLVCGKFNGITLYSDTVTIDSAYQQITGMTKAEFDKFYKTL